MKIHLNLDSLVVVFIVVVGLVLGCWKSLIRDRRLVEELQ